MNLEHDFGGTSAAAKIVRLFVPYWLSNDASIPLAYRLVEIEPNSDSTGDTTWLTRAAKAAKQASRRPTHSTVQHSLQLSRVVNYFEIAEEISGTPAMLSLQAYSDRIGGFHCPLAPRMDSFRLVWASLLLLQAAKCSSRLFHSGTSKAM